MRLSRISQVFQTQTQFPTTSSRLNARMASAFRDILRSGRRKLLRDKSAAAGLQKGPWPLCRTREQNIRSSTLHRLTRKIRSFNLSPAFSGSEASEAALCRGEQEERSAHRAAPRGGCHRGVFDSGVTRRLGSRFPNSPIFQFTNLPEIKVSEICGCHGL